ncbi:MAG: CehA/McbA family metallohydrolase [Pseudomonadota bacterium]
MITHKRWRSGAALLAAMLLAACGDDGSGSPDGGSGAPPPEPTVLSFSVPVGSGGDLVYVPFEVPEGVQRIEARYLEGTPDNIGIGVFDAKGSDFLGTGFRGIAGTERREFFIAGDEATLGFIPGPILPGPWQLVMPNYYALGTAQIEVTLHYGEAAPTPQRQAVPEQLIVEGGWYRGDLHVHTEHSSDAFASGKALLPAAMAERAKNRGLDFIALTDHNVSTQNDRLPEAQPENFLLLAGNEVTTWIGGPGHLIVAGLDAGEFIDWRFRPVRGVWGKPVSSWGENEQPIQMLLDYTRSRGLYTSAAHPYVAPGFGSNWGFFGDSDADPAALPDALEVWNGDFFLSGGTAALIRWDIELARGRRVCGNGGSDLHGIDSGAEVGAPTTVVYARELSRAGIVEALQACRGYLTAQPDGPALLLTATGADGSEVMMGEWLSSATGERAQAKVRVLGGEGTRLMLTRGSLGVPLLSTTVASADETFTTEIDIRRQDAVRAELWPDALSAPLGLNPIALSNPIFFGPEAPLPLRAPLPEAHRAQAIATLSTTPRNR